MSFISSVWFKLNGFFLNKGTIKSRLLLILLIGSTPVLLLMYHHIDSHRKSALDEIVNLSLGAADGLQKSKANIIDETHRFLKVIASAKQVQQPNSQECTDYLQTIIQPTTYINLGIPLLNGDLLCTGVPLDNPVSVHDRPYIQEAIQTRTLSYSKIQRDRVTSTLSINFAYPVFHKKTKQTIALAVAVVSLDWWEEQLLKYKLPNGSEAYIVDADDKVIASYPDGNGISGGDQLGYRILPNRYGVQLQKNQFIGITQGTKKIFTKEPLAVDQITSSISIIVGLPIESVLFFAQREFYFSLFLYFLLISILYGIVYWYLNVGVISPMNQIIKGVESLEEGRSIDLELGKGADEIRFLKKQFASMAKARLSVEKVIWKQANFDPLTNLPNRIRFYEMLSLFVQQAKDTNTLVAILFVDIDHFKEVNDTLGHDVGDKLLKVIAGRLLSCAKERDVVARLGGDEFTVILSNIEKKEVAQKVATRILDSAVKPIKIGDEVIRISVSVGVSFYPNDAEDITSLVKEADQAMYEAKSQGRDRVQFFHQYMQEAAVQKRNLINDLRIAIEKNHFSLHYQPIISCDTNKIIKAEALLRWNHSVRGLIPPDKFIPLAEETRLIFPIGTWVTQQAIADLSYLKICFGNDFQLSINVSPVQFMESDSKWLDHVKEFPDKHSIIVEITEGLLVDPSLDTKNKFKYLAKENISVAIDDFGTGYSSLAYISEYDIDLLKIDKSFVEKLISSDEAYVLCEAIIVMAHKLNIEVVAEGVESHEQYKILKQMGCDYVQGYYFTKPLPLEDLISFSAQSSLCN
jgi:diguanylate cyclase (GGDEF)-like protein